MVIAILAALGLLAGLAAFRAYNGLIHLGARSESAWSNIEALLKERHDLVPNLLETVRDYAAD